MNSAEKKLAVAGIALVGGWMLAGVAFWGTIIYVAYHFISKFW